MKSLQLALLLAVSIWAAAQSQPTKIKTATVTRPSFQSVFYRNETRQVAQRVFKLSKYKKQVSYQKHLLYVTATRRWADQLGVGKHWKVLVALFYTESGYRTDAQNLDSLGISQVRKRYRSHFEKWIKDPNFHRTKDYTTPETQIAIGVAAFKSHLEAAHLEGGTEWAAVRFYNGRGDGGRPGKGGGFHHLWKVRKNYKHFFGE